MDYEKAYKEALERARDYYEFYKENPAKAQPFIDIFPELAESEDERIRKAQLDYWRRVGGKEWWGVPVQETIAWLEKQGQVKALTSEDERMKNVAIDACKYMVDNFENSTK